MNINQVRNLMRELDVRGRPFDLHRCSKKQTTVHLHQQDVNGAELYIRIDDCPKQGRMFVLEYLEDDGEYVEFCASDCAKYVVDRLARHQDGAKILAESEFVA